MARLPGLKVRDACPALLVMAVPTGTPFTVNAIDLPLTPMPLIFLSRVALIMALLPNGATVGDRARVVGPGCAVILTLTVAESLVRSGSITDRLLITAVLVSVAPLIRSVLV